jgi:gamma-glutamylcyclotransferase (GGCT)/AIG2-like uncharacterized protein YtfP
VDSSPTKASAQKQNHHPVTSTGMPALDRLFVYGSLNEEHNLRLIIGQKLPAQKATLLNHRKIMPKGGFAFAVPWRGNKIDGHLLSGVTPALLSKLDDYEVEGEMFKRTIVTVQSGDEIVEAYAYIGQPKGLKPYFKKGFQNRDRIEEYVQRSVDRYIARKPKPDMILDRELLPIRVTKELLSEEIHSLLLQYFREDGLPPFIIQHELEQANLPDLHWIADEPAVSKYADNYISLTVKFMIFNQLEEKFRNDYRDKVHVSDAYFMHTLSALMALRTLTSQNQQVQLALLQLGIDHYDPALHYTDYAVAAIFIADELYHQCRPDEIVAWVQQNRQIGISTLGCELEFSNVGGHAPYCQEGEDPAFDSFYYFYDFDLMRRGWKMGAHVDDHGFLTSSDVRTRGFLEIAFGRYKLLGDVAKPATEDPWVLSQLIDLAIRFIQIKPHSLHISIGIDPAVPFKPITNPDFLLCLLLLGGDLRQDADGILREMRIHNNEIFLKDRGLFLSRLNRHHQYPEDNQWSFVVEYQFPRLIYDSDYQPLIMALKGFQYEANPYPFKDAPDCPCQDYYNELEVMLRAWADHPQPVSEQSISEFLQIVDKGLLKEAGIVGGTYKKYVSDILKKIKENLNRKNKRIKGFNESNQQDPGPNHP